MPMLGFSKPYYNVDTDANTVAVEEAWNVYYEALPQGGFAIRRRPGLNLLDLSPIQTSHAGQGVHWSDRNSKLYFIRNGKLYYKSFLSTPSFEIGDLSGNGIPATVAEGQKVDGTSLIYFANGGEAKYLTPSTNVLTTPTDSPEGTFITMMNNRFYANTSSHPQDFVITDVDAGVLDPTFWGSANNPFRAAQKPDVLKGLYTGWNEVYLWGTQACEVWQEDGVTPISPLLGSIIEVGTDSPYSIIAANNTLMGFGTVAGKRAVFVINGRAPKIISEPIARELQTYTTVSDAVGSLCFVGGLNIYLLTLPTEQVTWAYDFKTDVWSKWSHWDTEEAQHSQFRGIYGCFAKDWNAHVTMDDYGSLYQFDRDSFSDDGNIIRSSIRTGWIDHGTWDRKRCNQLIVKIKGSAQTPAKLLMRWRSDGFQDWSVPIVVDIQAGQQNDHFCKLNRMGIYRSRQYEFIMTDMADLSLVGLEIDLEKMRN